MNQTMMIDGQPATVSVDLESGMLRGEFVDAKGVVEFYAETVSQLKAEGRASLTIYLEACAEDGTEPFETYRGQFQVRTTPKMHRDLMTLARSRGESMNKTVLQMLSAELATELKAKNPS